MQVEAAVTSTNLVYPLRRRRPFDVYLKLGIGIFLLLLLSAAVAPWIAPEDPNHTDVSKRLTPPQFASTPFLGTDPLGRDTLSRIIFGSRVALAVSVLPVVVSTTVGTLLGLLAGYLGGRTDDIVSWLINVFLSIPSILVAIVAVSVVGPGLFNLVLILGLTHWVIYARTVRGAVLALRETEFVDAGRALGCSPWRIMIRHLLPNLASILIVLVSFDAGRMIIAESSLSFLGLGVEPEVPSWGALIAEGRTYMARAWWLSTLPGISIGVVVAGVNFIGEGLRRRFDIEVNPF